MSIARAEKDVLDEKLRKIKRSRPCLSRVKNNLHTPQNKNVEQNKDRFAAIAFIANKRQERLL